MPQRLLNLSTQTGQRLYALIERAPPALLRALSLAVVLAVAFLDWFTGWEVSFSALYLVPIAFGTWFIRRRWGVVMAILSSLLWLTADVISGIHYTSVGVGIWNTIIRTVWMTVLVLLLAILKNQLIEARRASQIDHLTQAYTRSFAYEVLEQELIRTQRYGHTLALAYLDVDDFKRVNDRFGHAGGDRVLVFISEALQRTCRSSDIVARIGGDEFLLVLPETNEPAARVLLDRLVDAVAEASRAAGYPVTVSVGAMCFGSEITSVDVAVREVDALMFQVKGSGKGYVNLLDRRTA